MELHLLSTPGPGDDIRWVVEACRPYLRQHGDDSTLAYLPLGSLYAEKWLEPTEKAFRGLARIALINTETQELQEMEGILRRATVVYVPGGNTFLLNHRMHVSGLTPYLRKKIQAGLPLVAFGAGTVLCGPNILTSRDLNMVATTHFEGLRLTPFNFHVHYSGDGAADNWLADYRSFHDNPVILLEDGASLKIDGKTVRLARGPACCWRAGQEKERLSDGKTVLVN